MAAVQRDWLVNWLDEELVEAKLDQNNESEAKSETTVHVIYRLAGNLPVQRLK